MRTPTFPRRFFSLLYWQTYSSSTSCQSGSNRKVDHEVPMHLEHGACPTKDGTVSVCLQCRSDRVTITTSTHAMAMIARSANPPLNSRGTSTFHLGQVKCRRLHCSYVNRWNVDSIRGKGATVWGKDRSCDGRKHMWASDQRSAEEHLRIWTLVGKMAVL